MGFVNKNKRLEDCGYFWTHWFVDVAASLHVSRLEMEWGYYEDFKAQRPEG